MKKQLITITLLFVFQLSFSQTKIPIGGGSFGLGLRTTGNVFLDDKSKGFGTGGQMKIMFGKKVNSEWFLDYINSRAGKNGYRNDYHVGWSVQFALNKIGYQTKTFIPFIDAGQCFDWTKVGFSDNDLNANETKPMEVGYVFSAATQAGLGLAYFPVRNVEINIQSQYMIHLTKDVHLEFDDNDVAYNIHQEKGASFKGHWLNTLSFTYYLFQPRNK